MSGIYIRGMEMPTSCTVCPMLEGDSMDGFCHAASRWLDDEEYWRWYQFPEGDIDDSKPCNCPLVPVPDHGRQDGLYFKYFVIKTETGEIVQDCFVLRPQKDKAAVAALLLYAKETENQELSSDIRGWLSTIIPATFENLPKSKDSQKIEEGE